MSALKGSGTRLQEDLFVGRRAPPATGPDLQQSLAEPHHDVQVHLSLRVSLLGVLVLALHHHVPEAAAQRTDARPEDKRASLNPYSPV